MYPFICTKITSPCVGPVARGRLRYVCVNRNILLVESTWMDADLSSPPPSWSCGHHQRWSVAWKSYYIEVCIVQVSNQIRTLKWSRIEMRPIERDCLQVATQGITYFLWTRQCPYYSPYFSISSLVGGLCKRSGFYKKRTSKLWISQAEMEVE